MYYYFTTWFKSKCRIVGVPNSLIRYNFSAFCQVVLLAISGKLRGKILGIQFLDTENFF